MKIEVDTVKGFQDYLPPVSLKRAVLRRRIERWYMLYGFVPLETPLIEYDELMKPDVLPGEQEDEAVSDRFRLKDRAGRNLGLRYEFTFQLSRILKQNPNMKLPFKRYQIGENFRDEPIRAGRTRQFTQCDVDIVGDASIAADAECLALLSDIFKDLGIAQYEIQVNNRKLLNAIIESVEIKEARQVMRELDKLTKIGEDHVKMNLRKYADANQILTLFKLMEKDLSFFIENSFEGASELSELVDRCKSFGITIRIVPSLIRGFGYYTGNIFEIVNASKIALAAGGRYDKSVGKYIGREIPAVGISFSIESLMALCAKELESLEIPALPRALLVSIGQDAAAVKLVQKLRKNEISCMLSSEKVGKALEYANAYQIPFVVFIGENEIKQKKFKLRDMKSGNEEELAEKELVKMLQKIHSLNEKER